MRPNGFVLRFLGVSLAAAVLGCATTGPGGKKSLIVIGDGEERSLGSKMAAQINAENRLVADRVVTQYVNRVGQRLVRLSDRPEIPYKFSVIESKEVNAFALPGGYIYVYAGLLKHLDTEAQLASVLGHEVSHVVARHGVKQLQDEMGLDLLSRILLGEPGETTRALVGQGLGLLMKGYTRSMESEADAYGVLYTARAGLNPEGMVQVLQKLEKINAGNNGFWENLASDHPPASQRIAAVRAEIRSKGLDAGLPNDPDPYREVRARLP